jgi:hypothetical protein
MKAVSSGSYDHAHSSPLDCAVQVFATNTFIREGRTQTPKVSAKLLARADEVIE